jgi:hypothetical protein
MYDTTIYITGANDPCAQIIIKNLILLGFNNIYIEEEEYYLLSCDNVTDNNTELSILKIYNEYVNYDLLLVINKNPISCEKNMIVLHVSDKNASFFVDIRNHYIQDAEYIDHDIIPIIDINDNVIKTNGHNLKDGDTVYIDFLDKTFLIKVIDNRTIEIDSKLDKSSFVNGNISYIPKSVKIINDSKYYKLDKECENKYNPFFSNYISSKICFEIIKLSEGILIPLQGWNHYELNNDILLDDMIIGVYGQNQINDELLRNLSYLNVKRINIINSRGSGERLSFKSDAFESETPDWRSDSVSQSSEFETNLHDNIYSVNQITNENIILCCINNYEQVINVDKIIYEKEIPLIFFEIDHLMAKINAVIPYETDRLINVYKSKKEISYPECMIQNFPNLFDQTVLWAKDKFEDKDPLELFNDIFYNNIVKILETYPSTDVLFWSKGKICPKPIQFDSNNENHLKFIELTRERRVLEPSNQGSDSVSLSKNYENNKIEWIHCAASIRCNNYGLFKKDLVRTKELITNVKENILNMNSLISNIVVIEMIKYFNNIKLTKMDIDIGKNNIIQSELEKNNNITIANQTYNQWYKFKCSTHFKLIDFKRCYDDLFKIDITMITCGNRILYADFIQDNNDKLIHELIDSKNNILSLSTDDDTIELPDIFIVI